MSTTQVPAIDMDKLNAFIGQFVTDLGAAVHSGMVVIGEKLGLYKALAHGPMSPAELAAIARGHWMIEDRLHWVRDMAYDEDRSQIRTASGPRSWPACATSPSPSCGWPATPASPPPSATTPAGQAAHYGRS